MKFLYLIFFLGNVAIVNAQPGDFMAMRKAQLQKVETALQNNPNDMSLVWERINLVFKPHFDLYKRAGEIEKFQSRAASYPYYILDDLDYLIANNSSMKVRSKQVSLADYYHRRGQFFYVTGYVEYALEDYLTALEQNPPFALKQTICLAIAAYYYNKDENYSLENYEKALAYIDLVTPKEDSTKPLLYERYSSRNGDYFQSQKLQLLRVAQKDERLVNYLKCIAKSHFLFYEKETKKSTEYQQSHSYTIPYSLRLGFNKLYEIAQHFYEKGKYEKAKEVIEKVISFLPRNKDGFYYETYVYGNYFLLLSKIYRTEMYQNVSLEIDNLLEGFGDSTQGFPSQATKQYNRLEELLQLYPNKPKLHLAKAIYLKKIKYNNRYAKLEGNIFESLQQSENLGLQDYRISYLRALVLKLEKHYADALVEINKAQLLSSGHVNVCSLKLWLLEQFEESSELEIKTTKALLEASKKQESAPIDIIVKMIDEI
ncbi:hypothetical protein [Kordia sp.]|uniref:hypothetical protein n=1 Tax=Kordia sp. TaxID=1965332 RepID=UPI003D279D01